ncbi:testis anion transporter 1 isoform X1 [Suricata suricatta]|uniref:Solute carrier family 26 member 8 n=1 Tax=Suricata suricatta TaxID=37032 RepID=A0A673SRB2_SURSU|nr:testis anion transporter 1 isoform X1 [Suricata suricatta]XP_029799210.1 testis anion transporter 1 isoform X1 [Suricata suricatta]
MMQPEKGVQSLGSKYRQNSFTYDVKRDVYNEETFQQEHKRKSISSGNLDIDITTFKHHIQCRCSWHKFLRCILTVCPFLEWMCRYRFKDWLLGDLLAGLSVGLVHVPQALTFNLLARQLIPHLNVCYAAFCSSVIYAIFGSCHQMSIGSFFLLSALMINVLSLYPFNSGHLILGTFIKEDFSQPSFLVDYNRSLSVVASTTFLTGIIQLSMGLLGFGFVATYLPEAAISAYLAATALHVILSQLTFILGIIINFHAGPMSFFYNVVNYCVTLPKANSTSILLFLTVVVALRINRCIRMSYNRYPIQFPMEVFLILGFTAFANKISMATETSGMLIEMIPYSFLFPVTPDLNILPELILEAFSLALVSSSLLIFVGKKIASHHNYHVNSNQDLIAIGLCNVVSSFFRACVFTSAIIRTIIQDKSGGRQQFASLVGAGVMLLLTVKGERFFSKLPNAVLAGIMLNNILPYLETIYNLPSLWRQNQYDSIIWMVTFVAAIFLGLDMGLLVSIAFAFFVITVRSHRTKIFLLGQIPNTNIYRSLNDYREVTNTPGVKIFQCCNSITFVNVNQLKSKLLKEVEMVRVPLKEEEVFRLFNQSEDSSEEEQICQCFCNCDEPEPPPRVIYTERFESRQDNDSSSLNLIRCSRFDTSDTSQTTSDEQVLYTGPSTLHRNQGQTYEDVDNVWLSNNPSRKRSMPPPDTPKIQERSRSFLPFSDTSLPPSLHTIILDFSMVHFVDSQASVSLRQMCNAFQNANILVLISGCHTSVVRAFEKNDFFDAGISKAQLFLTLHDAVLFALSRKFPESSELSMDGSDTVIQETYSEVDKNGEPRHKMSSSLPEASKNVKPDYIIMQEPITEEESELDLEMEPAVESEQEPGRGLEMDLYDEMEPESELEPETELETELEPETEPEFKPKPRSQSYPQQQYWPLYSSLFPRSSVQAQSKTQSAERKYQHKNSYSPKGNNAKDP